MKLRIQLFTFLLSVIVPLMALAVPVATHAAPPPKKAVIIYGGGWDPYLWGEYVAKMAQYKYCQANWEVQWVYNPTLVDVRNIFITPDPRLKAVVIVAHGRSDRFFVNGTGTSEYVDLSQLAAWLLAWPWHSFDEVVLHVCFLNWNAAYVKDVFREPIKPIHGHWGLELWPEAGWWENKKHWPEYFGPVLGCSPPPIPGLPRSESLAERIESVCYPESSTVAGEACADCYNVPPEAKADVDSGLARMYQAVALLDQGDDMGASGKLEEALQLFRSAQALGADVASIIEDVEELLAVVLPGANPITVFILSAILLTFGVRRIVSRRSEFT